MKEIDLIIEEDGILHPLEIKKNSNPDGRSVRVFSLLKSDVKETGRGGIICMTDTVLPIDKDNAWIPAVII